MLPDGSDPAWGPANMLHALSSHCASWYAVRVGCQASARIKCSDHVQIAQGDACDTSHPIVSSYALPHVHLCVSTGTALAQTTAMARSAEAGELHQAIDQSSASDLLFWPTERLKVEIASCSRLVHRGKRVTAAERAWPNSADKCN